MPDYSAPDTGGTVSGHITVDGQVLRLLRGRASASTERPPRRARTQDRAAPRVAAGDDQHLRLVGSTRWPLTGLTAGEEDRARRAALGALALASRACARGGWRVPATLAALAGEMARLARGGCVVRPRPGQAVGGPSWPPVIGHVGRAQRAALLGLNRREPDAFASAFSARMAQTRQPVVVPRISAALARVWSSPAAWPYLDQFGPGSIICVPVRTAVEVLGSLIVWRDSPAPPFGDDELMLVQRVAEHVELVVRRRLSG